MKIRKANVQDIDKIVSVEMSSGYQKNPIESDLRKLFVNFFNSKKPCAYILYDGDKVVGHFGLRVINNNCVLDYLAIIKKYHGKGFGKLLLNKIILVSKKLNCKKVKLSVRDNNAPAINLYKKYDFEIIGKNKNKLIMVRSLK